MTYILIAIIFMAVGVFMALLYLDDRKHVGDLYIFDSSDELSLRPELIINLADTIEALDLKNGEMATIQIRDERTKTRK